METEYPVLATCREVVAEELPASYLLRSEFLRREGLYAHRGGESPSQQRRAQHGAVALPD